MSKTGFIYFAIIGKDVKIGFSRNVEKRLKNFRTSSANVNLLCSFPGPVAMERRLHRLFAEETIKGELFRQCWRIWEFIERLKTSGLDASLHFLEETTPGRRKQRIQEEFRARIKVARQNKAQKDAYFAELVAERKRRLGW